MRGSSAETANLLTKVGCSATINETTEEKAYAKLSEILLHLKNSGVRDIFTNITKPKMAEVTLSNGNVITLRWQNV